MLDIRHPELRLYAFEGDFGLEREALRVTRTERMAQTPHPFPPDHPRIVRNFCENQTEINAGKNHVLAVAHPGIVDRHDMANVAVFSVAGCVAPYSAAARAAANSEHFTSVAPSIWRAKS